MCTVIHDMPTVIAYILDIGMSKPGCNEVHHVHACVQSVVLQYRRVLV
jgi:hypothetical protein